MAWPTSTGSKCWYPLKQAQDFSTILNGLMMSSDGHNWSVATPTLSAGGSAILGIAGSGSLLIAYTTLFFSVSTDGGTTWGTPVYLADALPGKVILNQVLWAGNRFIFVTTAQGASIAQADNATVDGVIFTPITEAFDVQTDQFYLVAGSSTVIASSNGLTYRLVSAATAWEQLPQAVMSSMSNVAYGSSTWVTQSDTGLAVSTDNGDTWTA